MASIVPEGRLVYGMQLPIQSQSRIYVEPWELDAGATELGAVARKADATGFFYIAVCDHVTIPAEQAQRMGDVWYDTVATLGWLAGLTEHARLLSHVYVAAYRHPLLTAKAFSTLDELSGGRAILGVGAGHVEPEFERLGVDFAGRGAATDEAVDVLRSVFDGTYPDAGVGPRPGQEHLPIWIGGSSKPALRRAGARGDGWLPISPASRETRPPSSSTLTANASGPAAAVMSPSEPSVSIDLSVQLPMKMPPTWLSATTALASAPLRTPTINSWASLSRRGIAWTSHAAGAGAAGTGLASGRADEAEPADAGTAGFGAAAGRVSAFEQAASTTPRAAGNAIVAARVRRRWAGRPDDDGIRPCCHAGCRSVPSGRY